MKGFPRGGARLSACDEFTHPSSVLGETVGNLLFSSARLEWLHNNGMIMCETPKGESRLVQARFPSSRGSQVA